MRIGIDLSGTKTEVIAPGKWGEPLFRHRLSTPRDDYAQPIETIVTLVTMARRETGQRLQGSEIERVKQWVFGGECATPVRLLSYP